MPMDKIVVEHTPPFTVKLTYFKRSGKYYSEGEYVTNKLQLFDIWSKIKQMFKQEKRPGLVDGKQEFITYVEVPAHPYNHPVLIFPEDVD